MYAFWMLFIIVLILIYILKTNKLANQVRNLQKEFWDLKFLIRDSFPDKNRGEKQENESIIEPVVSPISPESKNHKKPLKNELQADEYQPMSKKKLRNRSEWESLIGGKWLNRIGAVALILGAAFFHKTALDKGWFTPTVRVAIVALYGIIFLVFGIRLHKKGLSVFAQGLIGSGISLLYLSVYGSFNYYHLVSQILAFGFMLCVTSIAFLFALKYRSLAVALLGWFGGFLTPLVLSTGITNEWRLFIYLIILTMGIVAIVLKNRKWFILEVLSMVSSYIYYFGWSSKYYTHEKMVAALIFTSVIWGLFLLTHLAALVQNIKNHQILRRFHAIFNGVFYYFALYSILDRQYSDWMGLITFCLGGVYFIAPQLVKYKLSKDQIAELVLFHVSAIILLFVATSTQFDGYVTVLGWSVEAGILVLLAQYYKKSYVLKMAWIIYSISLFKLLIVEFIFEGNLIQNYQTSRYLFLLNWRDFTSLIFVGTMTVSAFVLRRMQHPLYYNMRRFLQYAWSILLFILLTIDTHLYIKHLIDHQIFDGEILRHARMIVFAVVALIYSLPMVQQGLKYKCFPIYGCGYSVMMIAILILIIQSFIPFQPIQAFTLLFNIRAIAILILIAGMIFHFMILQKSEPYFNWKDGIIWIVRYVIIVFAFLLITSEIRDLFSQKLYQLNVAFDTNENTRHLKNLKQLVLSGGWLVYSIVLLCIGIAGKKQYLRLVSIVLMGITILKIFIHDLSYLETTYRFISFMGLGLILLGVSYLYQRFKHVIIGETEEL